MSVQEEKPAFIQCLSFYFRKNNRLSRKEFDEELKDVLKEDGSPMKKSEKQWLDAVEQIRRYADAPRVEALRQGTTLHKIIMQFKDRELARIEEIE